MQDNQGVTPSGPGQSGSRPEPASRLGHSATVPNADRDIRREIAVALRNRMTATLQHTMFDLADAVLDIPGLAGALAARRELALNLSAYRAAHDAMQSIGENDEAYEIGIKLDALEEVERSAIAMETRRAETTGSVAKR